jgi:hypothetical protein
MQQKSFRLISPFVFLYTFLACDISFAQGIWTKAKETISAAGGKASSKIGGLSEQLPKWDPTNPNSDFNDWFSRRDPGVRFNKEAERTGRKFGEGLIEGAKPGIDLLIDGAGKKVFEVSERVNADVLATGTKLLDSAEKAAGRLLVEGEGAAKRVIDKTFERVDVTIEHGGQVASSVINEAMDRQAEILDGSLSRIENLSEDALARIEYLQSDSMGRIEAAISDQVPFTASDIFAQAETFILLLTVSCFLLGSVVFYLKEDGTFKRVFKEPFTWVNVCKRSLEALSISSRVLLRFGPPLVFSALIVHSLYMWHFTTTRTGRLETLIAAAEDAEYAGDFRTAAAFRMRLCRLLPKQQYMYEFKRDTFLSKYYQGHKRLSDSDIDSSVFGLLEADPNGDYLPSDLEALSVICYEASKAPVSLRQGLIDIVTSVEAEIPTRASFPDYLAKLTSRLVELREKGKRLPYGGKFVFIALIKQNLGPSVAKSVEARLIGAEEVASRLVECYPKYPAGLKIASIVGSYRLNSIEWLPSWLGAFPGQSESEAKNAYKAIQQELDSLNHFSRVASALDPLLSDLATLEMEIAPPSIVELFEKIKAEDELGQTTTIDNLQQNDSVLMSYISKLNENASRIYANGPLARLFGEQCAAESINLGICTKQMISQVNEARSLLGDDSKGRIEQYKACLKASALALDADQLCVAEIWLNKAIGIDLTDEGSKNFELEKRIRSVLEGDLAKAVCQLLD